MKPKHQRLILVVASMAFLCTAVLLVMQAFRENLVYFYSPSEIRADTPVPSQKIRIGGLVKTGSVKTTADEGTAFIISDGKAEVPVLYYGMLPNLFREGQGVIAEGVMTQEGFSASTILAKHDEKYMPREVVESLKKSGHWEEQYGK